MGSISNMPVQYGVGARRTLFELSGSATTSYAHKFEKTTYGVLFVSAATKRHTNDVPMPTSSFDTLVALNNRGIDLFTSGGDQNLGSASQCFRGALRILKQNMLEKRSSCSTTKMHGITGKSMCSKNIRVGGASSREAKPVGRATNPLIAKKASPTTRPPQSLSRQQSLNLASRLDQLSHFISTKPIKIALKEGSSDSLAYRSRLCTAIITFNLALTFHLMGLTCEADKSSRFWDCALAYYELTLSLRSRLSNIEKRKNKDSCLDLATVNNMAALHSQLGNASRARAFFQRLAVQVAGLDIRRSGDAKGFIANLMVMGAFWGQAASAAA